jgi:predicted CoA-binding protein
MNDRKAIDEFVKQHTLAIVGVSRSGKKFGNTILRELKTKGYKLYPVHPQADILEGEPCYSNLQALPEKVGGVIVVVQPAQTEKVVQEAHQAGIQRIWMQQGAESPTAIQYCQENGISTVYGRCIMMFSEPVGFPHSLHRWFVKAFGGMPK